MQRETLFRCTLRSGRETLDSSSCQILNTTSTQPTEPSPLLARKHGFQDFVWQNFTDIPKGLRVTGGCRLFFVGFLAGALQVRRPSSSFFPGGGSATRAAST